MRLVETDIPEREEDSVVDERPRPPRPERRRVYVSLILTLGVLCATVVTIYRVFPKRDNELVTSAMDEHRAPQTFHLQHPGLSELDAWTIGVVGEPVPWPVPDGTREVVGAKAMRILRRPAALVRYRIGSAQISLLAMRARDAPPRRYRRQDDAHVAHSWRKGPWTFVAVGPAAGEESWAPLVGAP